MNFDELSDFETLFRRDSYSRLSYKQCQDIHATSLEILESIGVRLDLPEAIAILQKAGAKVMDDRFVRIPHKLIENALLSVPHQLVLYDRYGKPAMHLEGNRCYYGPGSDCLNIFDHRTRERRRPVINDVIEGTILCDALPLIDFVMSMLLPSDVDQRIADTYQMAAMLNHTTKPVIAVCYEARGLVDAVEMAEAVVGGEQALRDKPILACYINVISGSIHNADALKKLLFLVGKGLPAVYVPASNAGITSPMTMAGAVALDNAGVLTGVLLSQLKREGTPVIWSAMDSSSLDMRTLVSPYAYPERGIMRSLARFYNIPSFSLAGATDAKLPDQQAAAEAALTLMADITMGGNIVHDLGYLESGLTFSFAQLIICHEIVSWIKAFIQEIEVSSETLALNVIRGVGINGHYISNRHTRQHFREIWYPDLFERGRLRDWHEKGSQTLTERAEQRVQKILDEHQPKRLPIHVQARINEIVQKTIETL